MINKFGIYLDQSNYLPCSSEDQLVAFNKNYKSMFTNDYWEFMKLSNGYEGSVGPSYLQLWQIENIKPYNEAYCKILERTPELTILGSDGGGMEYCYDSVKQCYVEIPLDALEEKYKEICGKNFIEFLDYLYNRDESYRYSV